MTIKLLRRSTQFLPLLCILHIVLAGCSSAPVTVVPFNVPTLAAATSPYWPTQAWRTSSPEEQGIDAHRLAQMLATIQERHLNLHSLLVIRNGYLVSETYWGSFKPGTRHELYSCTKSFVATLIGIAMDKGYIDRTDHRVVDLIRRSFANADSQKQAMTLEDLLTMRSGLDWQEGDSVYRSMYQSRDWIQFVLDKPMAYPPGTQFNYCSGCSHVLSALLQQTTNRNARDFAEQFLFQPLGISNFRWETDAGGIPIGGWGLQLTPVTWLIQVTCIFTMEIGMDSQMCPPNG